jgi:hypothetical protein
MQLSSNSRFVWAGHRLLAVIPCFRLIRGTGHVWQISPVTARDDQTAALKVMAGGADRAEADRARCHSADAWRLDQRADRGSVRGARGYGRLWRSDFMGGGVGALKVSVAPGPTP